MPRLWLMQKGNRTDEANNRSRDEQTLRLGTRTSISEMTSRMIELTAMLVVSTRVLVLGRVLQVMVYPCHSTVSQVLGLSAFKVASCMHLHTCTSREYLTYSQTSLSRDNITSPPYLMLFMLHPLPLAFRIHPHL
jgi:hypothetical protein